MSLDGCSFKFEVTTHDEVTFLWASSHEQSCPQLSKPFRTPWQVQLLSCRPSDVDMLPIMKRSKIT